MQIAETFATVAQQPDASDAFTATVRKLAALRLKTIASLTIEQPLVRKAAMAMRRAARGTKLSRSLRRKAELGRAGAF